MKQGWQLPLAGGSKSRLLEESFGPFGLRRVTSATSFQRGQLTRTSSSSDVTTLNEYSEEISLPEQLSPRLRLTFRKPLEILAMQFDPSDAVIENGYLEKGSPIAVCGIGGIGKSRIAMQMAIAIALGRSFFGWKTNGKNLKWLFLQAENGNKRLKADLAAMMEGLDETERQIVNDAITFHTLEVDDDGMMLLGNPHVVAALREAIARFAADIVVFDPLRDFSIGDLNSDADMAATLAAISGIVRVGNPKRIPVVVHHALSGKVGHSKAVGFERGGFGRNSKVLHGWVRAQINLAPYEVDSNEVLVVASGKANNAKEFEPFGIRLDPETMTYTRDESVDLEAWKERIGADTKTSTSRATIQPLLKQLKPPAWTGLKNPKS